MRPAHFLASVVTAAAAVIALANPASAASVNYVALGDSYSAGEGVRPYETGAGDPRDDGDDCHRSTKAYARRLRFLSPDVVVDFRACSGARAGNVYDFVQKHKAVPNRYGVQTSGGVLDDQVDLVTITLGGNDLHFGNILPFCFVHSHCMSRVFALSHPGADEDGTPATAVLRDWIAQTEPVAVRRVAEVLKRLRNDAPNARIVVLGYPPLMPTGPAPGTLGGCDSLLSRFDEGERDAIGDFGSEFNMDIYRAAADAGVEYVDPYQFWNLRSACGLLGPLINGVKPQLDAVHLRKGFSFEPIDRGSFHPNASGQTVFARAVACYLNAYPQPLSPFPSIDVAGQRIEIHSRLNPAPGSFLQALPC